MQAEQKLIDLGTATVQTAAVLSVSKLKQPATLQTPEIPYIQIIMSGSMLPLVVTYDTDEQCENAYATVVAAMKIACAE